jgi:4-amino-4-deoxy-L-arabinose transferase-like glycosyltransferase
LLDCAAMIGAGRTWLSRPGNLALLAVLALAAFLRLYGLQWGQYGSDDERLWALALRSVAQHALPDAGIRSSIGTDNGPFQAYLMMPAAALFGRAPIAGAVVVALLNLTAVYSLYRFVAEFFGQRPALVAALLFAANSWAVIYSRRMQAQDMLVPFQVLFFWNAARWLVRGRRVDLVLMFVWLAVLTQVYVLGFLHGVSAVLVLLLGWRRLASRSGLAGLLAAAAAWLVLSARYAADVLLPGLGGFRNVVNGIPRIDGDSVVLALTMASHKGFQTIAGQAGSIVDATSGFEGVFVLAEELLCAAGFVCCVWRLVVALRDGKRERASVLAVLLLWGLVPVVAFARHAVPLYPYYFVALVPLPAVFTGLLLEAAWTRGGAAVAGLLTANSLALAGVFFAVIPGYYTRNDYGLPYQYTFDVASRVERLAAEEHVGRVYVDGSMDPSEVMSSVLIRGGLDVFWLDDYRTPEFAAPAEGSPDSLYVTMADDTDTSGLLRGSFAGRQRLAVPLPGEGVTIRAYDVPTADIRAALDRLLPEHLDVRVANGMQLLRFSGDRRLAPGRVLRAALAWTWPGGSRPPDTTHYAIFGHLLDGSGVVVAEVDHPLQLPVDWKAGQEVVQWLDLPVPARAEPGHYVLDLGVYDQDAGVARQRLTDTAGKDLGSSLALGPFVVPPPPEASAIESVPEATLGDGIELASHSVSRPRGQLQVDLVWQAKARPSRDYTVFVHVLDAAGEVVSQADSQPRGGDFPTSIWLPGDSVADSYTLAVPAGRYTVEVGMYYLPTLERLGEPSRFVVDA